MLDAPTSSQNSESLSQDRNTSSTLHIPMPDDSVQPIYTEQRYLVSSPIADTRHPTTSHPSHHLRGYLQPYRSGSTQSIEQLGSREMSGSRDITDTVTVPLQSAIHLNTFSRQESLVPIMLSLENGPDGVYPVALENFQRYEARRRV